MSTNGRVKQLRTLLDRVERLPDSPERTRMLRDLRARVVEAETGISDAPPRALQRSREEADAAAAAPAPQPQLQAEPTAVAPPAARPRRDEPAAPPAAPAPVEAEARADVVLADVLADVDELLYLGELDLQAPQPGAGGTRGPVPWARGMRG